MARFTTAGGSGDGTPGAPGADGADGADGLDSLFLGTWNSVTEFLAAYQGGPVGLPDGDWWAFVKDNANPNKVYVVREDPNSATGWVIDDNEHFIIPSGSDGADGEDGAPGADGADGEYPNYLGEYNNGAYYPIGGIVSIPVGSPYGNPGQLFIRSGNPGNPGYPPGSESWTEYTNGLVVAGLPAYLPLKSFQEASNYAVDYGYFTHATYGNSIAIARTPQVDAYMNYAITAGVSQSWTFRSFGSQATFSLTLGVPVPNVENVAPNKEIWILEYNAYDYGDITYSLANGNEYGLYLTDTGALGSDGADGATGATGATGPTGADGDPLDFLSVPSNIVPTTDNAYSLGTAEKRWSGLHIGPGTLYITDQTLGTEAEITVDNGVLQIDGANQLQVGQLKFFENTIESTTGDVDIEIGLLESTADLVFNRDVVLGAGKTLTFNDDTVQTTAYTGDASDSTEVVFTVAGGTLGTQPTFTGAPLFSGSYVKTGPLVHFQIQVDMDNITNFGTGQYYVDLPFPAKYGYKFREGCLHDISANKDFEIGGHVYAGQSRLTLTSVDTQSGTVFDIPFTASNPTNLSTADNFHISGSYITD